MVYTFRPRQKEEEKFMTTTTWLWLCRQAEEEHRTPIPGIDYYTSISSSFFCPEHRTYRKKSLSLSKNETKEIDTQKMLENKNVKKLKRIKRQF